MKFNKFGQYAGQVLRYVPRAIFQPKVIIIAGVKIDSSLPCFNAQLKKQLYLNAWESDEIAIISQHIEGKDTVLELGGCIGFLSTYVAKRLTTGCMQVIEANPHLIPVIEHHMNINNVKFKVINGIVGDEESYNFYIADSIISSSMTQKPGTKKEIVSGISLRDKLREFSPSVLIIDIEGGEYGLLKEIPPLDSVKKILIEFHGIESNALVYSEIINNLAQQGFELIQRGDNDDRVHFFRK
ncbi:hypothetical protein MNBD_GAMMA15-1150 [hydrothermal vent metagenome]|uniref:Methyltransferase FkbM domain-containing protein n=1 Tax=hydrothermal vent metagenome TaxID=652676 RepID=A0A3B0YHT1_9ZZZZ